MDENNESRYITSKSPKYEGEKRNSRKLKPPLKPKRVITSSAQGQREAETSSVIQNLGGSNVS